MSQDKLNYDSPASIQAFLEQNGLAVSKRLGQNFLIDRSVRSRIVKALEVEEGMQVWEIGPGIGAMTILLLEEKVRLTAFEIDYGFVRVLKGLFSEYENFCIVKGDVLKTLCSQKNLPARIFGNLPYNSAFAIISDILEMEILPQHMVFTLQKEAAHRMVAGPGTKDYSSLSVLCTSVCDVRILFDIGSSAFWPRPRVTSSVVQLIPKKKSMSALERKDFSDFVRAAFSSRRKTLRNTLRFWIKQRSPFLDEAKIDTQLQGILEELGIESSIRAEALAPDELFAIYRQLQSI
ncbi:MAG TPA: 16S rRNA (adenine(1518)-N(6)/adenine(1519)-N(6))-dimethyltransferase RsmA [Rectinema sp.]|jgi:16S rRNA (adenine1518-N6/adenine1519-N6)-dimethyltransferase|nr:16S rRNA (adenine(1518)-N(6)/adenine(1519)-N(6))-dimethyltransferase RsmA [Rectinema sp.]HOH05728.1 16S rRNA (adenine(1518)-N(6)/adenine(1519)-N(6))-dimethyltransferase RsmA [Rectinema sp.]HPB08008.1 16S rRNA (adenine(1518)-N(6)/adenine(1519)-N(6))-dimethyltransferase RsmA [Rectinema sp.]HPV59448.1 16S rRNA (adenine(1518)-N(6)/adenine(1519)-N(6))-dimethyltransferase RsmA [Rectinema sp.]HQL17090.1 16S rRNA (adenine(1518)-N(6)/adenine(1519)-N(6))-dimethyltransferase RsmA [Rectinema sp.]